MAFKCGIFINACIDSGIIRVIVLSIIHVMQAATISSDFFSKVPTSLRTFLSWTTNFTALVAKDISPEVTEQQLFNIDAFCFTLYFIGSLIPDLFNEKASCPIWLVSINLLLVGFGVAYIQRTAGLVIFIIFLVIFIISIVIGFCNIPPFGRIYKICKKIDKKDSYFPEIGLGLPGVLLGIPLFSYLFLDRLQKLGIYFTYI